MPATRRSFLAAATTLALASHPALRAAAPAGKHLLLIGTETNDNSTSKGIYLATFDSNTGSLTPPILAAETPGPTFLALSPNNRVLYAVNENGLPGPGGKHTATGMVTSFAFNPATQTLTQINQVSSAGNFPVHVATDHTGGCVFAANYGSGSAASYRVDAQGRLTEPVSTFLYSPPPEAPNKHSRAHRATVSPDNQFLLVNDLGLDRIYLYALDAKTARLTPHGYWLANPGDGPRALHFHPNKKIAYCVNESQPTLHVLGWKPAAPAGLQLTNLQTVRLAESPGQCHPGDIVLDRRAQHAYVSTRRDNTVAVFRISPDGRLTQTGKIPCGGAHPRHLILYPTGRWLLVANQDSGNIAVLPVLLKTGEMTVPGTEITAQNATLTGTATGTVTGRVDQPMCLLFARCPSL